MNFRYSRTPRLVFIFTPLLILCIAVPVLMAEVFWRTLGTEIPLSLLVVFGIFAAYFILRRLKTTALYQELMSRDRGMCGLIVYISAVIFPCSALLLLNNVSIGPPVYSEVAYVTFKVRGSDKAGREHDYVAFKNEHYNDYGVLVTKGFYDSVQSGTKITVFLKTGGLGFPVVVGLRKA